MKQKLKQNKGITLVSLVVTIIVLIILAGISLYLVLGGNGLIENAKGTKPIVDISSAQERLELVKGPVQLEKYGVNLDDYLEELEKVKEKYEVDDVERIDNDNAEIIIGGKYKFIATDEKNGNVKITYQGEVGGLEISPTSGTYKYPTTGTFEIIKNISGGELSVKSENENIAKASINGTIVIVESQEMAGTTKIVVTSAANGEYAQGKAIYTAIVENGTISLDADAYTGNYDGKDHDAVSNVKVTPADATLTYSLNGGEFSSTIPKVNGATTYTVVIKATKDGYATKTLTKNITIKIPCEGITLDKTTLTMNTGEKTIITPTITPSNANNKNIIWESSDTSIATVSSTGEVTAVGSGKATITAKTTDGSNLSATCTVTVRLYIYNYGDENTTITGGITAYTELIYCNDGTSTNGKSASYTKNSTNLYGTATGSHPFGSSVYFVSGNKIDVSDFSTLKIIVNPTRFDKDWKGNTSSIRFGISTSDPHYTNNNLWNDEPRPALNMVAAYNYTSTLGQQTVSLDVSNYNDKYKIYVQIAGECAATATGSIYALWLE